MDKERHKRLEAIFRAVFRLAPGIDVGGVNKGNTESWDSLAHVTLIAAMENEFGVTIDMAASLRIDSFTTASTLLQDLRRQVVS